MRDSGGKGEVFLPKELCQEFSSFVHKLKTAHGSARRVFSANSQRILLKYLMYRLGSKYTLPYDVILIYSLNRNAVASLSSEYNARASKRSR